MNVCEIRGGVGCRMLEVCGLRNASQKCRAYNLVPNTPVDGNPPTTATNATADDGSTVTVNVTLPGVGIGIKI